MTSLDPGTILPNFPSISDTTAEVPLMKFNSKDPL